MTSFPDFAAFAAHWQPQIERALQALLPEPSEEPRRLHEAMRYSMFPGGKRLRPLLALLAAEVTGGSPARALVPAAGLECLHTYSLIHDDLPCMDDDALRRGRATCHVRFDEATAVLAGDALQALAFEAVAQGGGEAVAVFARAAGSRGMAGGQQGDMDAQGWLAAHPAQGAGRDLVEWIHDHKTGALILAALEVGLLAGGGAPAAREPLRAFGQRIGRAFQIADDCLDLTSSAALLGKGTGQDRAAAKLTYPAVLGLEASQAEARRLVEEAIALAPALVRAAGAHSALDARISLLQDVASFTVGRKA